MKRIISIVIIIVALLGIGFYEVFSVNKVITTLEHEVNELQTEIKQGKDNLPAYANKVESAKNKWDKAEPSMCLVFSHKDLSTISDSLTKLLSYVQNDDYDNAYAEVDLLKSYSDKNKHIMGFNAQNIF